MKLKQCLPCIALLMTAPAFSALKDTDLQKTSLRGCSKKPETERTDNCPKESQRAETSEKKTSCPRQGEVLPSGYAGAYSAPASIDLQKDSGNHYFADFSFTYWYAGEEGLTLASNGVFNAGILYFPLNSVSVIQTGDYHPGFKVGIGIVKDHQWVLHGEYTWFRGKNVAHSGLPLATETNTAGVLATTVSSGTSVWVVSDWFMQGTIAAQALPGTSVTSSWKLSMDLLDLTIGRPFYQASRLIVSPYGGLMLALIRQSMTVSLTEAAGAFAALPVQPIGSRNHSHSWAIGPKLGADVDLLLGYGFRLETDVAASLLYTQYTTVSHREDPASSSFNPGPYSVSYTDYSCLRPVAELGLGVGWGSYYMDGRTHLDLSVDYDFSYFWNQNMMRKLLDDTLAGTSASSADLFIHGLTITVRIDY